MSRDEALLHPDLRTRLQTMKTLAASQGLPYGKTWTITCTARFAHEQIILYLKGRCPVETQNGIRRELKWPTIIQAENRIVTWTIAGSKHLVIPGERNFADAFDFVILSGTGKAEWDVKVDVDRNAVPDYEQIGRIAESVGLTWGGRWKTPDYAHIQR